MRLLSPTLFAIFLILVSGCTSTDRFSQKLDQRGLAGSKIAVDYERGRKLVEDGEENIDDGNALIRKGQDQVAQGEQLKAVARGRYCVIAGPDDPDCS